MASSLLLRSPALALAGRRNEYLLAFLIWSLVALVFAVHFHIHYAVRWSLALRWAAIDWYVWGGLSAAVLLLVRVIHESGLPTWIGWAGHAAAMGAVIASQVALVILIDGLLPSAPDIGFWPHFQGLFAKKLGINVVTYAALAAGLHLYLRGRPRTSPGDAGAPAPSPADPSRPLDRLLVERRGAESLLDVRALCYVEAAGNYVNLHAKGGPFLVRRTLVSLAEQLGTQRFARVSRSKLVNLDLVEAIEPDSNGAYRVVLRDGTILRMTRAYRKRFVSRYGPRA